MVTNAYPIIDGIEPSWADIAIRATPLGGALVQLIDIKSINTGTSVEIGDVRGASGGRVRKRTTGASKAEASVVLYRTGYDSLLEGLLEHAPLRGNQRLISLAVFGVQILYSVPGSSQIFDRRLKGCRIAGDTVNAAEGPDAAEVEVPLSVIEIAHMIKGVEVVML
jgi:hypothetical protein